LGKVTRHYPRLECLRRVNAAKVARGNLHSGVYWWMKVVLFHLGKWHRANDSFRGKQS